MLVTRGHSHDVECLLEVLDRPVGYIGMIGSQRRVDAVFQLLTEEMHIPAEKLDRVYAPIGIAIGAARLGRLRFASWRRSSTSSATVPRHRSPTGAASGTENGARPLRICELSLIRGEIGHIRTFIRQSERGGL